MPKQALVITSISGSDNACIKHLAENSKNHGCPFYVSADTQTPRDFSLDGCNLVSISDQGKRWSQLDALIPQRNYARKNFAYLAAMEDGADEIRETDDDNWMQEDYWQYTTLRPCLVDFASGTPWANVYSHFGKDIWPRGLPLEYVKRSELIHKYEIWMQSPLIMQGMVDENPDVDAVYRMTRKLPYTFGVNMPVILTSGSWCPFNSQNTVFNRAVFPLLYMPSHCSIRMTDIWRSFVAQRCLWELGSGVVFHKATMKQIRNEHNLLRDFELEQAGYMRNDAIRVALESFKFYANDIVGCIFFCYQELVERGVFPQKELDILGSWLNLVDKFSATAPKQFDGHDTSCGIFHTPICTCGKFHRDRKDGGTFTMTTDHDKHYAELARLGGAK